MKNGKIITAIVSAAIAAALGLSSFAACKNKCEHVYRYTVTKEATCSAKGSRQGVCGICGDVIDEAIPIDPDAHDYGDWVITLPTESGDGTAEKTCSYDSSHVLSVTLPRVTPSGTGYDSSEIITPATAASEGKQHLVLNHAEGDIAFDVVLSRRSVTNLEDAVTLAATLGSLVRTAEGYYRQSASGPRITFETTFGDGYTHITEQSSSGTYSGHTEYWYSRDDDGNPFGVYYDTYTDYEGDDMTPVTKHTDPRSTDASESNLLGFGYQSGGGFPRTYGAEETLLSYYEAAHVASETGTVVKYDETFEKYSDGSVVGGFSYSYYENPNFCRYNIGFETDEIGVIKTLTVTTEIIRPYMIAEDEDGEKIFYEDGDVVFAEIYPTDGQGNPVYETDANGNPVYETDGDDYVYKTDADGNYVYDRDGNPIRKYAGGLGEYYSDSHADISIRTLVYESQTRKTSDDIVEENPYGSDVRYVQSFDVEYDGAVIGEDGVSLPTNRSVVLTISNVLPTTASLEYDPLELYVRTATRDLPVTGEASDTPYNLVGYFIRSDGTVQLNSQLAGEVTLVLKTQGGKCEKEIKIDFEPGAPSSICAEAYTYDVSGNAVVYTWEEYTKDSPATVYVGQPLCIRASTTSEAEAAYSDTSFTAESAGANDGITFTETTVDDKPVVQLVASKAGEYYVYIRYVKGASPGTRGVDWEYFKLVVEQPPALSSILKGEYTGTLRYVGENMLQAAVTATFSYGNNWRSGTIAVTVGEDSCTYTYTYDETTRTLTTTRQSGVTGTTYDFVFTVNEAYDIELSHSVGVGDIKETIVLTRPASA